MMKGNVISVKPTIRNGRLKITGKIQVETDAWIDALLPSRELAAILPRSILVGTAKEAPLQLLDTIQPIISRLTVGRTVRLWLYKEQYYFSFMQWNDVRFEDALPGICTSFP